MQPSIQKRTDLFIRRVHLAMSSSPTIQAYPSLADFLADVRPKIEGLPFEWLANFPLGTAIERVGNEQPSDHYASTYVGDDIQLLYVHTTGRLIIGSPKPIHELNQLDEQMVLLADWIVHQNGEIISQYTQVMGRAELSDKLVELLTLRLTGLTPTVRLTMSAAVVDRETFVLSPKASNNDIIRALTLEDDIEAAGHLYQEFERDTMLSQGVISPLPKAMEFMRREIARGTFWGYFVGSEQKLAALAKWRRPTKSVAAIAYVVTGQDFRRKGYAGMVTSALVEHCLKNESTGKSGKEFITLFYNLAAFTGKIYRKLGFIDGYRQHLWDLREQCKVE
ncbi:hypothetical protein DL96DRAFT_1624849 [Flagelloscypha sp. PMI_526]|nr:hypothetical protein DL96DRAFT_1624849 [Flagelloscypha sp. PMI_526]